MSRSFRVYSVTAALVLLSLVIAACGGTSSSSSPSGAAKGASVNVDVTLTEFSVTSSLSSFKSGVTYHFTVKNAGKMPHQWLIIPKGVQDASKAVFGVQQDQLPAGATVGVDYKFTTSGDFEFACLLPGHYAAGMHTPVTVN